MKCLSWSKNSCITSRTAEQIHQILLGRKYSSYQFQTYRAKYFTSKLLKWRSSKVENGLQMFWQTSVEPWMWCQFDNFQRQKNNGFNCFKTFFDTKWSMLCKKVWLHKIQLFACAYKITKLNVFPSLLFSLLRDR